jgi:hypothetical protein
MSFSAFPAASAMPVNIIPHISRKSADVTFPIMDRIPVSFFIVLIFIIIILIGMFSLLPKKTVTI